MKGDFYKVTYAVPGGTAATIVQAKTDGSEVELSQGKATDPFLTIEVNNKAGKTVETFMFAKASVIALEQGHQPIPRKRGSK